MSLYHLFQTSNIAQSVGEYFGLIETLEVKINRLTKADLDAGIRSLNQARNSTTSEQRELIRDARRNFNKAITFESKQRLASAYLGLAFCHYYFDERQNCKDSLEKIIKMDSLSFYHLGDVFIHFFDSELTRVDLNFSWFQRDVLDFIASNLGEYPYEKCDNPLYYSKESYKLYKRRRKILKKKMTQRYWKEGKYIDFIFHRIF